MQIVIIRPENKFQKYSVNMPVESTERNDFDICNSVNEEYHKKNEKKKIIQCRVWQTFISANKIKVIIIKLNSF
jgi:hypothetical protein